MDRIRAVATRSRGTRPAPAGRPAAEKPAPFSGGWPGVAPCGPHLASAHATPMDHRLESERPGTVGARGAVDRAAQPGVRDPRRVPRLPRLAAVELRRRPAERARLPRPGLRAG